MTLHLHLSDVVRRLSRDRRGQDFVEYSLMAAFVATTASAIFPPLYMPVVNGVWSVLTNLLALAGTAAGS